MSTIRAAFSRSRERDSLADVLTTRKTPGPKPQYTETVDVAFTPEQVRQMTRRAEIESRSRNALIRDAVAAYLARAGA